MPNHITTTAEPREALERIERWLLESDVQLKAGDQQGGVAEWLDANGKPKFVSLGATGCYMTAMEWLSAGAATSEGHAQDASDASRRSADWLTRYVRNFDSPMRHYLEDEEADWHNSGIFTFDLAMAARGLGPVAYGPSGSEEQRVALKLLNATIEGISFGADILVSHEPVAATQTAIPDHWSTKPGPHHLKAAAAILELPPEAVGKALGDVARQTWEHWAATLKADVLPCQDLRPLLNALEGMLVLEGVNRGPGIFAAERLYVRLMEAHDADNLPTDTVNGGVVRSDVLAQALRAGLLLRGSQCLAGPQWTTRLDRLADALLDFVEPDGGVSFTQNQGNPNTLSAIFAHQALYLHVRRENGDALPAFAFDLLV